jgi:sec-independent protein translocase protein TatB
LDLFGIGPAELILVLVLALIFIGPGKMPEVAASIGKALREFRAASAELTEALNVEIAQAEQRKAGVPTENGSGHSLAEAADAQIVAQPEPQEQIDYAPPEVEPADQGVEIGPARILTIDEVLADLQAQEEAAAAKRKAEAEAARLAVLAEELARKGMAPLPESLLRPSTDAPMVVVNPTETLGTAEERGATEAPGLAEELSRKGMAPLSEALLRSSTDAPMVVVNPTEERGTTNEPGPDSDVARPAEPAEASAVDHPPGQAGEHVDDHGDDHGDDHADAIEYAASARPEANPAARDGEALEPSGVGRSEVS